MAALLMSVLRVDAIPAYPAKRVVTLENGKQVTLTLRGDEHFSYFTDDEHHAYRLTPDGRYMPISLDEVSQEWTVRARKSNARRTARRTVGTPSSDLKGKKKGLVILMAFGDKGFSTENVQQVYQDFFNKEDYYNEEMTGSVRDYFRKQSYGNLDIEFDVAGPYTAAHSMIYYGGKTEYSNDDHPEELIKEACEFADKDVNFKDYDWDGDGTLEQVFVIYAGYGEASGAPASTIWPHESHLKAYGIDLKLDGVQIDTYACGNELYGTEGTTLNGIGTACHEFSHCLGLPDFYDTSESQTNYGMGSWDVMCNGCYNNYSRTPSGYTSYERWFSGWLEPTELKEFMRVSGMKPLVEEPQCYVLYNEGNRNEYYLLENRQPTGFDAALPGHGLLVLHVNYDEEKWTSNTVNVGNPYLTIIPADNSVSYGSEKADPFPGTKNVTALTNFSTPAATLYENNTDGTKFMNKPITAISESKEGYLSFVVCHSGINPPTVNAPSGETADGFTISWSTVTDATSYEIELTEIPAAQKDTAEAKRIEIDLGKSCYSKSTGFSDIGSKLSSYGFSSGWNGTKLYTSPDGLKIGTASVNGSLASPWYYLSDSGEMTLVLGATDAGSGSLTFQTANAKNDRIDTSTLEEEKLEFEFTKAGKIVLNMKAVKDAYKLTLNPDKVMYLNYLAIYNGTFSASELGITDPAGGVKSARRKIVKTTLSTSETSYAFTGLNPTSTYQYRVRGIGPEVTSAWSEMQTYKFSTSGIKDVVKGKVSNAVYSLDGRYVGNSDQALPKGVYIINGKKVVK